MIAKSSATAANKSGQDLDTVVARLKGIRNRQAAEKAEREQGKSEQDTTAAVGAALGWTWASERATPGQLAAIEAGVSQAGSAAAFFRLGHQPPSPADALAAACRDADNEDGGATFAGTVGQEGYAKLNNPVLAAGFVAGAREVWAAVRERL